MIYPTLSWLHSFRKLRFSWSYLNASLFLHNFEENVNENICVETEDGLLLVVLLHLCVSPAWSTCVIKSHMVAQDSHILYIIFFIKFEERYLSTGACFQSSLLANRYYIWFNIVSIFFSYRTHLCSKDDILVAELV